MGDSRLAFVTGHPVKHSRSPLIHNHWLQKHSIAGEYLKHPCEPDKIIQFISEMNRSDFIGGNVTIPYKETVVPLMARLEPAAKRLGAVNTVWLESEKLIGDNTDGYGFLANLDQNAEGWDLDKNSNYKALVLGSGGASRAIIDGLILRGFSNITIANRTIERAQSLVELFGPACGATDINNLPQHVYESSLVVNTTSVGMEDNLSPIDLSGFSKSTTVTDIIYTPIETPLLKQANLLGMKTVDGLGMLLHQAVPGFERWFGIRPEVTEELKDLILKDLGETS